MVKVATAAAAAAAAATANATATRVDRPADDPTPKGAENSRLYRLFEHGSVYSGQLNIPPFVTADAIRPIVYRIRPREIAFFQL